MKTKAAPKGRKVHCIAPSNSGFGIWESTGTQFVRKDSLKPRPDLDGLIQNQTGPAVEAETEDGDPVLGMLA